VKVKKVRWACPYGCPAVLGPSRPRKDDVCRFCLSCSSKSNRLVPRTAPSLDKKRSLKTAAERREAALRSLRATMKTHRDEQKSLFRCGAVATSTMRFRISSGFIVEVRPSKTRRATKVTEHGVILYDFDGCDKYDATAISVIGQLRWLARRLSPNRAKSWIREHVSKVRYANLILERLEDAEYELGNKLRAKAAVRKMEEASGTFNLRELP
jgi:hypothetical protein